MLTTFAALTVGLSVLAASAPAQAGNDVFSVLREELARSFGGGGATPAGTSPIQREVVPYAGRETPGTIVINSPERRLYLVLGDGTAMRYGIGVGRPGFEWGGVKSISRKAEWPDWTPPPQMLKRRPDLPRHMAGGPTNPLGARAMYLGSSLYRIHGSNEPRTIGQAVSSGCIRMTNDDVTDLYERVKVGTKVVVIRG
ncbi:L,D-transpeptidase [Labrys wisconsinensis]|uniref:L,D-transpeptidase n=1 Tax=Labrys wisconsinensis TaxID=425677 RepID=UPI003522C4AF